MKSATKKIVILQTQDCQAARTLVEGAGLSGCQGSSSKLQGAGPGIPSEKGSLLSGVDGPTVPGHTRVTVSDSSSVPESGDPSSVFDGVDSRSSPEPWVESGGGLSEADLQNWRPLFHKRHRRYAELRQKFGPPLLAYPPHGELPADPPGLSSLRKPELFLDELPDKDSVGDSFPGSLCLEKCQDIIRDPGGNSGGRSTFCHGSVGHYNHACENCQERGYLELLAKRSVDLDSIFKTKCPGYWIQGSCENGHRYAKELYCGREWCEVCGEEWSATHQRRFSRWISKATQIRTMGYFVFTIPEELRAKFRTKRALSRLGHQVQELLKSYGYSRGLRRWHFFGDQSTRWHPHLNVLVDGGYLAPEKLDRIKAAYAGILGCQVADVFYRYRRSPGEMVHSLKYVTRATFRDYNWDPRMALELRGFRNQLWWGSGEWDRQPAWSLDDLQGPAKQDLAELDTRAVESLESGICPSCGLPLDWSKVQPISVLEAQEGKRSLGAGYWELPAVRPPPGRLKFPHLDTIEYWLKVCRAAGVQVERVWPDG